MDTTEPEHKEDVRGASDPYEPPDGVTLRRFITLVMGVAVGVLIFAVVALGLQYGKQSKQGEKARTVATKERLELKEQLAASTLAITALLDQQSGSTEASQARLKDAIAQVVAAQQDAIEKQFVTVREANKAEHERLTAELKRLQETSVRNISTIVAGPAGPPGPAGPSEKAKCQIVCL